MPATVLLTPKDLVDLNRRGARGEILTYFHDENGKHIDTDLSRRCVTLAYDDLVDRNIIAAAGGPDKVDAIRSILRSGLLSGLITDEVTATKLAYTGTQHASLMKLRSNRRRVDRKGSDHVDLAAKRANRMKKATIGEGRDGRRIRARSSVAETPEDKP